MSEPENRPVNVPGRERLDPALEAGLDPGSLEPLPPAPPPEPLFNKKVMLLWALAALMFGLGGTFVLRTVKSTAREAILEAVKEAEQQGGGRRVKVQRNGAVITITTETPPAAKRATPAPAPAGSAQPKEAPAPAPVPAPARK